MSSVERDFAKYLAAPKQTWGREPTWVHWGEHDEMAALDETRSLLQGLPASITVVAAYKHGGRPRRLGSRNEQGIDESAKAEFETLAEKWERETEFESVVARAAMHPAYQRIIGMGDQAVVWILRRLAREPRQWFWALTAITGEDPAEGCESATDAADAWLAWGELRYGLGLREEPWVVLER